MVRFAQWLLFQETSLVDPAVVASYERAFHEQLEALIQRRINPELRKAFEAMRSFRFVPYIVVAPFVTVSTNNTTPTIACKGFASRCYPRSANEVCQERDYSILMQRCRMIFVSATRLPLAFEHSCPTQSET